MTLKELTAVVLEIRDNHLEHMKQDIDKIDEKVSKIDERLWGIALLIMASIAAPIILKLLGI